MSKKIDLRDVWAALVTGSGSDDPEALLVELESATFAELGYDSLAILETGNRLRRETGIKVPDSAIANARDANDLLAVFNDYC